MTQPLNAAAFAKAVTESIATVPRELVTQVAAKLALLALTRVVERTPVDTGRLRGAWQVTIGQPASTETGSRDPRGESTVQNGQKTILEAPPFAKTIIANPVPYAQLIEFGQFEPPSPENTPEANAARARGRTPAQRANARLLLGDEGAPLVSAGFALQAPQGMVGITFGELVEEANRVAGSSQP